MNLEVVSEETKQDKWFDTLHLQKDLKSKSVSGGMSTMGAQIVSFLMNMAQTTLLARLLTPDDFGLVAMVTAITGFATIFKDFGLSAAVIQKENLQQSDVSAAFWLNVFVCLGISLVIALLAPLMVYIYNEERVFSITLVLAVSVFITGLSIQHSALMKRQMLLKSLSLVQLMSVAGSILTGVVLAWFGFGYWAIIISNVVFALLLTIALWITCDWRPSFTFSREKARAFLRFGAGVTGFDVVNHFSRNMDNFIIGRYVGSGALGIYSNAYKILMLPITQLRNPLNGVALPALSSLTNDKVKYASFFSRYLFLLAFLSMPIIMYSALFADELILILLGDQWVESAYIFKILAAAAFIQTVFSTQGLILITTGKVKKYFYTGLINAIFTVTGFAIGVQWGIAGVAMSYVVVIYIIFLPMMYYSLQDSPVSIALFMKEISLPLLFSVLSGCAMFYFRHLTDQFAIELPALIMCAAGFVVGAAVYFILWFITPASKAKLMQVISLGTGLISKKLVKK